MILEAWCFRSATAGLAVYSSFTCKRSQGRNWNLLSMQRHLCPLILQQKLGVLEISKTLEDPWGALQAPFDRNPYGGDSLLAAPVQ